MELRDYLHGLRRRWAAIILLTVLGVGVAAAWAMTQPRVYQATASAYISVAKSDQPVAPGQNLSIARTYAASFLDLATWRAVAEYAIAQLNLPTTPDNLVNQVTITNPDGTAILQVQAQAGSPAAAQALAGAWVGGLQATVDKVDGTGVKGSAPVNVHLGDPASLPQQPISPDVKMALTVGGVIGLGFGIAFGLIRSASDRRIRPGDAIDQKLGSAVMGTIPLITDRDQDSATRAARRDARFVYSEALRTLRTNLQFIDVDHPPRTIVITSPLQGDGKSRVACELAKTLAATGSPVILVDGDLRRSTVAKYLELPSGAGLTDVLAGRVPVADVLQQAKSAPNLLVLTAGSTPPNPSEVLGSARMHTLLGELAAHATVIIDAPPLLAVTDGAVLAHQADGALLVIRAGKTTYELAERALDTLHKAHGRMLGIVLNRVPLRGIDASPYAYAYRKSYATDSEHSDATTLYPEGSGPESDGEPVTPQIDTRKRTKGRPAPDTVPAKGEETDDEMNRMLGSLFDPTAERRPRKPRDRIRRS